MSNHGGSHMLNKVLLLLEKEGIFEGIGKHRAQEMVLRMIEISDDHDCNPGEILKDIGTRLGICHFCLEAKDDVKDDLCVDCREEP